MSFNVLVVDDSPPMRQVMKKVIQISGFDVGELLEAGNGKEALKVLSSHWVDVILLDIHMPEMDGIEMLRRLSEEDLWKRIPVIVVTTEGREQVIEEAKRLGAKGYVKKPFNPEQIKEILMSVMGQEYERDTGQEA
ncbi:MAG: response regulator [Deltaproteobacteria bacterium]|nr:MAG: response regulator [Deltaproteobacteria bacterium]